MFESFFGRKGGCSSRIVRANLAQRPFLREKHGKNCRKTAIFGGKGPMASSVLKECQIELTLQRKKLQCALFSTNNKESL
jgi:hypothetical protein